MIKFALGMYKKYEELFNYLVVGVLTTIVSWGACFLFEATVLNPAISWQNALINTIGWVAGVLFGYVTNRKFVFKSTNPKVLKEFLQFSGSRVSTLIMDIVIMEVTVTYLSMDYWIAKIFISSVLVMATNYVFSKLFIFKKNK
ncbi:MAG: GtrA family protein [Lachnospiraceae bacterium]